MRLSLWTETLLRLFCFCLFGFRSHGSSTWRCGTMLLLLLLGEGSNGEERGKGLKVIWEAPACSDGTCHLLVMMMRPPGWISLEKDLSNILIIKKANTPGRLGSFSERWRVGDLEFLLCRLWFPSLKRHFKSMILRHEEFWVRELLEVTASTFTFEDLLKKIIC